MINDRDPYKLLRATKGKMCVDCLELSLTESALKKGGILQRIARRDTN